MHSASILEVVDHGTIAVVLNHWARVIEHGSLKQLRAVPKSMPIVCPCSLLPIRRNFLQVHSDTPGLAP
eukprot:6239732-Amphidinium_carterae.2